MVNIDDVYQKVLAIANKEQRGYITPQEFNLMADKAQLEIVINYIHELKMAHNKKQNTSEISDPIELLDHKMSYVRSFNSVITQSSSTQKYGMPYDFISLNSEHANGKILYIRNVHAFFTTTSSQGTEYADNTIEITPVDELQLTTLMQNPLTRPTKKRPVYFARHSTFNNNTNNHILRLEIFPSLENFSGVGNPNTTINFIKKPEKPKWGFIVANQKPLYNFNTSVNFELHPSEEENLVTRILQLAGVIMEKPDLVQGAYTDQQITTQKQNS